MSLLTELYGQDRNDRKARQQLKERLQIIFPELVFLSYNKNTPQIVIASMNNISCTDFIRSSKEKMLRFVADELRTSIQNMMQAAPSLPLATKTRRSICTRPTPTKVFDKLSRAAFAKHTLYNWRNGEATYLVLLTRYCLFDIQRNIFHCKTLCLVWNKCLFLVFRNLHYIGFNGKNSFKLKISGKVLNLQNSTLGLKFEYISYQISFKKSMIEVNECVSIAKSE